MRFHIFTAVINLIVLFAVGKLIVTFCETTAGEL
jgi:hypothetical protein